MTDPKLKSRGERINALREALTQRILVIDGAMGTMIQGYRLAESDYRGEHFASWPCDLKGNNDILVLTRPKIVSISSRSTPPSMSARAPTR